ncbi:MAG: RusA family crossover junction endodeoxyribonuclease [Synergistaceae bacterium]|nr:RusA family crossover junction endodeoxyribonuclease [Synergistaceae bacterium]
MEIDGLPPTVNHMYGRRGSRTFKSLELEAWQEWVSDMMREMWKGSEPHTGEVALSVEFQTNSQRKWDVDNRLKALIDCLAKGGIILDDRQVASLNARRVMGLKALTKIEMKEYTG